MSGPTSMSTSKPECVICGEQFKLKQNTPYVLKDARLIGIFGSEIVCKSCFYVIYPKQFWTKRIFEDARLLSAELASLPHKRVRMMWSAEVNCSYCNRIFHMTDNFVQATYFSKQFQADPVNKIKTHIYRSEPPRWEQLTAYPPDFAALSFAVNRLFKTCPYCVIEIFCKGPTETEMALVGLEKLARHLGYAPAGDFLEPLLQANDEAELRESMEAIRNAPTYAQCEELFGGWYKALDTAGVFGPEFQRTVRGYRCLAKDGDLCLSLAEKRIDDFLFDRNIPHTKEPRYPDSNYRADWEISLSGKRVFIEFFGLAGDAMYDARVVEKLSLAAQSGITMIALRPGTNFMLDLAESLDRLGNF